MYVDAAPTDATFTYAIVGDTLFLMPNTIQSSLAYNWDFGNAQTSSAMYPYLIIDGTVSSYNVSLSIMNLCGSVNATETVIMSAINAASQSQVQLFPNPMSRNVFCRGKRRYKNSQKIDYQVISRYINYRINKLLLFVRSLSEVEMP